MFSKTLVYMCIYIHTHTSTHPHTYYIFLTVLLAWESKIKGLPDLVSDDTLSGSQMDFISLYLHVVETMTSIYILKFYSVKYY